MSCGRHHPAKHAFAHRVRYGTKAFTRTPKRFRQLFLNEMKRSNNPLRAIEAASIDWSTYQEWLSSGFITQEAIDAAAAVFHSTHPNVDMLARKKPDDLVLGGLPIEAHNEVKVVRSHSPGVIFGEGVYDLLKGYSESEVLSPEGWIDVGEQNDDL